ncbi:hypothetical protein O185_22195 [Photorhabdus temperata J3]|uniref:Uncharacterized protein n=1 Tax=Photorhabdus temperata J3 TaxID=1389415 RepID=U7QWU0_PHOTE|nr:hypothetical protein O185_22195 [Photorhabdus temperata J3]
MLLKSKWIVKINNIEQDFSKKRCKPSKLGNLFDSMESSRLGYFFLVILMNC